MNKSITEKMVVGKINTLKIDRFTEPGIYLLDGLENDVLLPNKYVTEKMKIGDLIDVFVYRDSEDRVVATTLSPIAKLYEFGLFEVVSTTPYGAFVNWGLEKDLFVPKRYQKKPLFEVGDKRVLRIIKDEETDRVFGTEKFMEYLEYKNIKLTRFSEVDIFVFGISPLGYKVIVNNKYDGLVFEKDCFEALHVGDKRKAFVKNIRADGKVDVSLTAIGSDKSSIDSKIVLEKLKHHNGFLPYNYKSDVDDISDFFKISKKAFKASLTKLKESNLIDIKDDGIYLLSSK